jgi:hypothetical protein
MDDTGYSILPPNRTFQRTARRRASAELDVGPKNGKEYDMRTDLPSFEQDKKALLSILKEMSKSMTGAQSTKQWASDAI